MLALIFVNGVVGTPEEVAEEATSGGWGFWHGYDQRERTDKRRELEERKAKTLKIKDSLDRQIALEQRRIERHQELESLTDLVKEYQGSLRKETNERIDFIARQAINRRTFSAMERLERELALLREEELFLMLATQILLNE